MNDQDETGLDNKSAISRAIGQMRTAFRMEGGAPFVDANAYLLAPGVVAVIPKKDVHNAIRAIADVEIAPGRTIPSGHGLLKKYAVDAILQSGISDHFGRRIYESIFQHNLADTIEELIDAHPKFTGIPTRATPEMVNAVTAAEAAERASQSVEFAGQEEPVHSDEKDASQAVTRPDPGISGRMAS